MGVHLRAKFEVSSIILTGFRRTSACQKARHVAFTERIVYILCGWLLLAIPDFYCPTEGIIQFSNVNRLKSEIISTI